jgi:nitrite reductase (NADH) small subunit
MKWVRVTEIENIPVRQGRVARFGSLELAIFNLGGAFRAVESRCPHKQGPLADGIVAGDDIICPLHNWRLSLDTGFVRHPKGETEACVKTYPCRAEAGIVLVAIPKEALKEEAA